MTGDDDGAIIDPPKRSERYVAYREHAVTSPITKILSEMGQTPESAATTREHYRFLFDILHKLSDAGLWRGADGVLRDLENADPKFAVAALRFLASVERSHLPYWEPLREATAVKLRSAGKDAKRILRGLYN